MLLSELTNDYYIDGCGYCTHIPLPGARWVEVFAPGMFSNPDRGYYIYLCHGVTGLSGPYNIIDSWEQLDPIAAQAVLFHLTCPTRAKD